MPRSRSPIYSTVRLLATILPAMGLWSCDRPPLTDNGVIAVFGSTGLGWGDFSYPRAIAASADNRIFVVDKSGRVQRFAAKGTFEIGWWMPEWKAGKPVGLTVADDGRVFVADTHYGRVLVFDAGGQQLGTFGRSGDGPGEFRLVTDVAIDDRGFIYVAEYGGNDRISKFDKQWSYICSFGDGEVLGAELARPAALAIDGDVLWVADACNHRILKFSLDGTCLGGFGEVGTAPGQLRWPYDINLCRDGTLMVSEFGNNRLQWFTRDGTSIRTWGQCGRDLGELYSPWGAVQAPDGLIYVLDSLNNRVQVMRPG